MIVLHVGICFRETRLTVQMLSTGDALNRSAEDEGDRAR